MEPSVSYPVVSNDDFLEFKNPVMSHHLTSSSPLMSRAYQQPQQHIMVPHAQVQQQTSTSMNDETIQQLKVGFNKMMGILERLEQRLAKVEHTTQQILKTQQDAFHVPFMSQTEIDHARQVAEQLEKDTSVAKQLQAAFNKETEVKRNITYSSSSSSASKYHECPICGARVPAFDLEVHVDGCLRMFSDDPKKEAQIKDTQKKMESGFFARVFGFKNNTNTKTETTTTTTKTTTSAPVHLDEMIPPPGPYHGYGYPSIGNREGTHPPMMMPMYYPYPSYPPPHMNHLQD